MFAAALLLLLLAKEGASDWTKFHRVHEHELRAGSRCADLRAPRNGLVSCHYRGVGRPCHGSVPAGTTARYECIKNFSLDGAAVAECSRNGTWTSSSPTCRADCGKSSPFVALIVNGQVSLPGSFPWQVAIYNYLDGNYEFWCGGSLISEYSVITAAHCTWKVPVKNLVAAVGKFFRDLDTDEDGAQKIQVIRVEMLSSYQDVGGNYNGDLAVAFLERAVETSPVARPICIDWNEDHVDRQLEDGNAGTALGWGLTENDTFSRVLRVARLPVRSDSKCIAQQHRDFRKFVTYTTFCAGVDNGSGVCNGDSGGGLAFVDDATDTWYLQGVVSVSPRRRGTSLCDPNFYTIFTKVTVFVKWLKRMRRLEEELATSGPSANDIPGLGVFDKRGGERERERRSVARDAEGGVTSK